MAHNLEYTAITPTGDRHKSFKLCWEYVNRQTIKPKQWIIVDDGKVPLTFKKIPEDYHRRIPLPNDPSHTIRLNISEALKHVKTDFVIIFEDDDWYSPEYAEKVLSYFSKTINLVGGGNALYYHIPFQGYYYNENTKNASLCQTAFKSELIPRIINLCDKEIHSPFIDIDIWSKIDCYKLIFIDSIPLCVGIKGLSGSGYRVGQTYGHRFGSQKYIKDNDYTLLKSIIGEDCWKYIQ